MVPIRRHAGNRHPYFAAGGLVLAGLLGLSAYAQTPKLNPPATGSGNPQGKQQQNAADEHKDRSYTVNAAPNSSISIQIQHPANQDGAASKDQDQAHWYARPDWWIAGFTAALFSATGALWVFTALLWRTTKNAVSGSEKTVRQELRAYVNVEILRTEPVKGERTIFVTIKNFGKTPARNVAPVIRAGARVYPFDPNDCVTFPDPQPLDSKFPLAPGAIADIRSPVTPQEIKLATKAVVWVVGKITYLDAFDVPQTTNIRYFARQPDWESGTFIADYDGNQCT